MTMEAAELKTKFHNLIDRMDNYDVLEDFYRVLNDFRERNDRSDIIDDLTDDDLTEPQRMRLSESIKQSETGKTIPHEAMKTFF